MWFEPASMEAVSTMIVSQAASLQSLSVRPFLPRTIKTMSARQGCLT